MRVATWNVNGIRKRFDEVVGFVEAERPDVLCLQEIKASEAQVPESLFALADYRGVWHGSPGGYSGVSVHLRRGLGEARLAPPPFDLECRAVQADVGSMSVLSVYVPNGGRGLPPKLAFLDALEAHVRALVGEGRSVLVCGDLNVARSDLDLHPKERKPGCVGQLPEERARIERLLEAGLDDVVRSWAGERDDVFTWWAPWREHRAKNRGWRIDYVLATRDLAGRLVDVRIHRERGTSDHGMVIAEFGDEERPE